MVHLRAGEEYGLDRGVVDLLLRALGIGLAHCLGGLRLMECTVLEVLRSDAVPTD